MKILIIRHGEPDYSIDSLTEKGWREAELLSRRLAPLGIRDFYVSPLGRAQDKLVGEVSFRPPAFDLGVDPDFESLLQDPTSHRFSVDGVGIDRLYSAGHRHKIGRRKRY